MNALIKVLKKPISAAIVAILFGFCVAAVVLAAAGYNPIFAFSELLRGIIGRSNYISNVIIKATPILFSGIGIAFAYKAGLFNIGAEGQYIVGTVCAVMVGSKLNLPMPLQIPIVLLAGMAAGMAAGALVGWLKAKFSIHEVITSIMCNWIALYFCNFIVVSPLFHRHNSTASIPVNPSSYTMLLPEWKKDPDNIAFLNSIGTWLKDMLVRTDVNFGFILAVAAAIFIGWFISRTKIGYEIRAVGLNRDAAKFAGISVEKNIVLCMAISGGLCGLGGALTITGTAPHALSTLAAFENNGFNGLSVAFIAGCSPVGCIPAALLFSGLIYGGQTVQQTLGAPSEIINITIGTIVFFIALGGIVPALAARLERRVELAAGHVQTAEETSSLGIKPALSEVAGSPAEHTADANSDASSSEKNPTAASQLQKDHANVSPPQDAHSAAGKLQDAHSAARQTDNSAHTCKPGSAITHTNTEEADNAE